MPVAASFSSSDSAAQFLDSLLAEANKNTFKVYVKCAESSYERDDFVEVIQNLIGLRDNYEDYWDLYLGGFFIQRFVIVKYSVINHFFS